jgi:hypothetical protein
MKLTTRPNPVPWLTKRGDKSTSQYAFMSWHLIKYKEKLIILSLHLRHYENGHELTSYEQENL